MAKQTSIELLRKNSRNGFTLIELLVVIFIIGLLSAIIFPRFAVMREKARDTERITDVRQIQNALEVYYNRQNRYPDRLNDLSAFMPQVPTDPSGGSYRYNPGGSCGGGPGLYSLSFTAENPSTFADDTTVTVLGINTICIDLVRSN